MGVRWGSLKDGGKHWRDWVQCSADARWNSLWSLRCINLRFLCPRLVSYCTFIHHTVSCPEFSPEPWGSENTTGDPRPGMSRGASREGEGVGGGSPMEPAIVWVQLHTKPCEALWGPMKPYEALPLFGCNSIQSPMKPYGAL